MPDPTRCTGHCCDSFSVSMDDVRRIAATGDKEAIQVRDMVRPLLPGSWNGFSRSRITEEEFGELFTCTNLGPGHDCLIYETRPAMCSRYPYGWRCAHPDCTSSEAKALPSRPVKETEEVHHA